jgi:hypothetical protein
MDVGLGTVNNIMQLGFDPARKVHATKCESLLETLQDRWICGRWIVSHSSDGFRIITIVLSEVQNWR